jgi:Fic family protein
MEQIAKALELKSELDKLRPIDGEREAIIMQKFRLDWDYHSNHLEGNSLTYCETKALILFGITAQGKPLKDHIEITGHDEAIKWVSDIVKGDYPLTESFIRELHVLLLKEPYEVDAITPDGNATKKRIEVGTYKSVPNHVKTKTGEIFRFATPEETPALMHDLLDWYHQKKQSPDVNPIILAAEFHYKFIRIHPFDDGNGRIARILMNFILMQFNYPPVIIKTNDKGNYFSALQLADSGMIELFLDYIAQNLIRSLEIMIAGAKGESIEEPDDLDKEIALLKQKLKALGKKAEIVKTKEAMLDIYDDSIAKLCRLFISICEKFDQFYIENKFRIMVNNAGRSSLDKLSGISIGRDMVNADTYAISLQYEHIAFSQLDFNEFSYQSRIDFDFKKTGYIVNASGKIMERLYTEQLTDKEINELVQSEAKRHRDFITEKLKEVENRKT